MIGAFVNKLGVNIAYHLAGLLLFASGIIAIRFKTVRKIEIEK